MRRRRHVAPSVESIEAETAEFRATAAVLTQEMEDLRADIACTAADLADFARKLREASGDE